MAFPLMQAVSSIGRPMNGQRGQMASSGAPAASGMSPPSDVHELLSRPVHTTDPSQFPNTENPTYDDVVDQFLGGWMPDWRQQLGIASQQPQGGALSAIDPAPLSAWNQQGGNQGMAAQGAGNGDMARALMGQGRR